MSTRRQFLALGSAATALSALPERLLAQFPTEVFSNANLGAYTQGLLTQATFERHVGSVFKAFMPDGSVTDLTLLSVTGRTSSSASTTRATAQRLIPGMQAGPVQASPIERSPVAVSPTSAFDLHFSLSGPAIDQGTYTLDHGILGRFAAFVVPGLSATGGNTCGASFNYLSGTTIVPGPTKQQFPVHVPVVVAPVDLPPASVAAPVSVRGPAISIK